MLEKDGISIVGKNGVYVIKNGEISLVTETKNIKDKVAVNQKLLKAIKSAIDANKEK